jgi:hypothetical protein
MESQRTVHIRQCWCMIQQHVLYSSSLCLMQGTLYTTTHIPMCTCRLHSQHCLYTAAAALCNDANVLQVGFAEHEQHFAVSCSALATDCLQTVVAMLWLLWCTFTITVAFAIRGR